MEHSTIFRNKLLEFVLTIFLASCVFDPADKLFSLKIPLFSICWLLCILFFAKKIAIKGIHKFLLAYVFLMIIIPLISIFIYFLDDGSQPYEGFSLFKAYILISLSIILYLSEINLLRTLSRLLNLLSILILIVYFAILILPSLIIPITLFGETYGILLLGDREYSSELKLTSVFFVTSPMLCISIAYYFQQFLTTSNSKRFFFLFITIINSSAMFIAGTRNNMLVAICLPLLLYFFYSKHKVLIGLFLFFSLFAFGIYYNEEILIMLSPDEESNEAKLGLVDEYFEIFSKPAHLFFGQGLGAYYNWKLRGPFYISELTYFEVIRNYGLLMGIPMILLMFFPVFYGILAKTFKERYILLAYFSYLIMCISNPLFFSSLGVLILSIIIANIFINETKIKSNVLYEQYKN